MPNEQINVSWEEATQLSLQLADKIVEHCKRTGDRFDYLIVTPRGGYHPAHIVARRLGFNTNHLLQFCIRTYETASNEKTGKVEIGQVPLPRIIKDANLLVVDDVCDSGQTLQCMTNRLLKDGAKSVCTATLHYKPSLSKTDQKPDCYVEKTDAWVNYPWEAIELSSEAYCTHSGNN
jgi:hypoxanthine phosphoribosyltransferase